MTGKNKSSYTPVVYLYTPVIPWRTSESGVIPAFSRAAAACSANLGGGGVVTASSASAHSDLSTSPGTSASTSG